ncbi:MAG: SRPBCC domain-containing protein [Woeseiaceae bacterium]|nr:SRPBCC domain-containing protein [Woeseiaceae bacterium]
MSIRNLSAKAKIRIRRSPPEVFAAFADAEKMSKFWFSRRDDGLVEGETLMWYLGAGPDAYSFEIQVKEIREAKRIVIDWQGLDGHYTQVAWEFEEEDDGDTVLTIEETGFSGDEESIVAQVVDSARGFNQVIVAAKALVEHGIELNVVADHA